MDVFTFGASLVVFASNYKANNCIVGKSHHYANIHGHPPLFDVTNAAMKHPAQLRLISRRATLRARTSFAVKLRRSERCTWGRGCPALDQEQDAFDLGRTDLLTPTSFVLRGSQTEHVGPERWRLGKRTGTTSLSNTVVAVFTPDEPEI